MSNNEKVVILKKNTKSICHICFKEIPVKVIEDNEKVYMMKTCPEHRRTKVLTENGPRFIKS